MANARIKEIDIRKVLGASTGSVLVLMTKEVILLTIINVIGYYFLIILSAIFT